MLHFLYILKKLMFKRDMFFFAMIHEIIETFPGYVKISYIN